MLRVFVIKTADTKMIRTRRIVLLLILKQVIVSYANVNGSPILTVKRSLR